MCLFLIPLFVPWLRTSHSVSWWNERKTYCGEYPIFRLYMHVRPKGYGFRERQSSNRVYERFYFICMLLFNSNFPAHLLTADVCMCVCMGVCIYICIIIIIIIINLIIFSLTSSSSSSAGTQKVVSFFWEKELLIIHRYHLIVEM